MHLPKYLTGGGVYYTPPHPLVFGVTHSNLCVLTPVWKILSLGNLKSNFLRLPNFIHPLSFFLAPFFLSFSISSNLSTNLCFWFSIHLSADDSKPLSIYLFPFSNFLLRNLEDYRNGFKMCYKNELDNCDLK